MGYPWLDVLRMELDALVGPDFAEPRLEVSTDDHIVGEASDELRRLYNLRERYLKRCTEEEVRSRFARTNDEAREAIDLAKEYRSRAKMADAIFWAALKDNYSLWQKPTVGIRQGWKVVWSEEGGVSVRGIILGG